MNRKSLYWGVGITAAWLAVIIVFWIFGGLKSPSSLNELGDFLAGIFAPVAFLWLILGYVQQGKQLEQNSRAIKLQAEALNLQIDEMRESVKQQAELANIQKENLEMVRKQAQPQLSLAVCEIKDYLRTLSDGGSLSSSQIQIVEIWIRLDNFGAEAKNVNLYELEGERIGAVDFVDTKAFTKMLITLKESEINHIQNNEKLSKEVNLRFLDKNYFEYNEHYVLEVWIYYSDQKTYASIIKK